MKRALLVIISLGFISIAAFLYFRSGDSRNQRSEDNTGIQDEVSLVDVDPAPVTAKEEVVLPIREYVSRRTYKAFGEYIQDRFVGYHVGDDIEFGDVADPVPVVAIAPGIVRKIAVVSGYGGVIVVAHSIGQEKVNAIYGHLDIAQSRLREGDSVLVGDEIAVLGEEKSKETDGERKHLHFALYAGDDLRLRGYEKNSDEVSSWINPTDFFASHGVETLNPGRSYDPATDLGGDFRRLRFAIPQGMGVEYIPQIQSLNVYSLSGPGTARERSKIFLRYFDASDFLTLSTVTIHAQKELTVGAEGYIARQYDIEKKVGVTNFSHQPSWRNARHTVTDFRDTTGFTRYYVVAKNPMLSDAAYDALLFGAEILP